MGNPEQALQKAVFAVLSADAAVAALVGTRIFDRLIDKAELPYLVLGETTTLDWSTSTEGGTEHVFVLEAWSKEAGKQEAQAIASTVRSALHDRPLALDEGVLVNLRLERVRIERIARQRLHRATMRLRAVIEA